MGVPAQGSAAAASARKVLIVEDCAPVRLLLEHIVAGDRRLRVVASVGSGEAALRAVRETAPDVISMDIRLPGINGLELTRRIMAEHPTPIVVVSASVDRDDLNISMNALRAGALAILEKPAGTASGDYGRLAHEICDQLFLMSEVRVLRQRFPRPSPDPAPDLARARYREPPRGAGRGPGTPGFQILGMAASTGGPAALVKVLAGLGAGFPLPVAVVQHMGARFLDGFVAWLGSTVPQSVGLALGGARPEPGRVYVAPAGCHLGFQDGAFRLDAGPGGGVHRPSADALFTALARNYGSSALGVLLTGMGRDGADGLRELRRAGGYTLAEDATTAVVFGMPAAAEELGAVCDLLPLGRIAPRLCELAAVAPRVALDPLPRNDRHGA